MKLLFSFALFTAFSLLHSQSLPIDFETSITTSDFIDFDGGTATVIPNPQSNGINTSTNVAQIVRNGGQIWAGSKIDLSANLDFTTLNAITMKVYTTAPVGTIVKFKLEGNGTTERDVPTTVSNEWEILTWDFTGEPTNFNSIVFMFDFGNVGDGSANSTFLFDDVGREFGGLQLDLPVDFEGTGINYTTTDFGGNVSSLEMDPEDPTNNVVRVTRTDQAATYAGTTIGTNGGFASDIPLSLSDSKMTVRVWSPEANTPIRLKVEDSDDPTHTCETETNTTLSGEWEVLEFDFTNQAPGTESLSVGLSMGWTYNMASIFFNFGAEGAVAGEQTYYFDDVKFGELVLSTDFQDIKNLAVYPNPTSDRWIINTDNEVIKTVDVYDLAGKRIAQLKPNQSRVEINTNNLVGGTYLARIFTDSGMRIEKLVKQ